MRNRVNPYWACVRFRIILRRSAEVLDSIAAQLEETLSRRACRSRYLVLQKTTLFKLCYSRFLRMFCRLMTITSWEIQRLRVILFKIKNIKLHMTMIGPKLKQRIGKKLIRERQLRVINNNKDKYLCEDHCPSYSILLNPEMAGNHQIFLSL